MRILLIRHAKAADRALFFGNDMKRPLVQKGIERSKKLFGALKDTFKIDLIVSSEAVRAYQTAKILNEFFKEAPLVKEPLLNPGASESDYLKVIKKHSGANTLAMVGHEPDISETVGYFLGCEYLNVKIKKSSITELLYEEGLFELRALIYPSLLERAD